MTLLSVCIDFFVSWVFCALLGWYYGFLLVETPWGDRSLRAKLHDSLQATSVLFALGGITAILFVDMSSISHRERYLPFVLISTLNLVLMRITRASRNTP